MSEKTQESERADFSIVGIGASAGGLKTVEAFLKNMPSDSGMAFVFVFHLDPKHKSEAAGLLGRYTQMPVTQIKNHTPVEPDHAYVIPPGHGLALSKGELVLSPEVRADGRPLVIDQFFRSLAEVGERAIGVVLSGMGSEGSQGLKAIKEVGGITMVQDEAEAEYDGMPHSAIQTGLIDFVLPVAEIGKKLLEVKDSAIHSTLFEAEEVPESDADILRKIFVQLRTQTGHDFSHYKQGTALRRITRRMQVWQAQSLEAYLKMLRKDPAEVSALFRELLISVTNFFRDPGAFAALEEKVVPNICDKREEGATVRIWVPGCATGEEAYSLAMLLKEACDGLASPPKLQIFATDVDERALEVGRRGLYPDAVAGDMSESRLKRFFTRKGSAFEVAGELREMILFARHDILRDPPFSRLDLISCRNVMIYLNAEMQTKVFELFHFALKSRGYLFLGNSESLGEARKLFSDLDRKAKIFQGKRAPNTEVPFPLLPSAGSAAPRLQAGGERAATSFQELARQQLLARYAPPCVIVDENHDVAYISGRVGKYLAPSAGAPSQNILEMAREGLGLELRTALYRAARGEPTTARRVRVQTNGEAQLIGLTVQPLTEAEGHLLVVFEDLEPDEASAEPPREGESGMARQLEQELKSTQESLQTSIEELETSNEELQASNEELQSLNEELRSTTEELETGKEELQSANEELLAVNQELQGKNDELARTNSDLNNFIASTEIGTLFLDKELRVRRYTPRLADIFNLIVSDIGRSFAHLTHNLEAEDLLADAERVLRELVVVERELAGKDGHFYQTRLRPYLTEGNKIGGVVLTFVDISERHRHEEETKALNAQLEAQKAYAENIVNTMREPLLVLDASLRVTSANSAFYRDFQTAPQATEHTLLYELDDNHWDIPELRRLPGEILPERTTVEDFEVRHDFGKGERVMLLNARRLEQEEGLEPLILLAVEDVTESKRAEREVARLASIVDSTDDAIISKNLSGVIESWNKAAEKMFGYTAEEAIGKTLAVLIIPADRQEEEEDILRRLARGESIDHFETVRKRKDGSTLEVSVTISPLYENGRVIGASKIARDITLRKRNELALQELNEALETRVEERTVQLNSERQRFRTIFESAPVATALTTWEGKFLDVNKNLERLFGLAKKSLAGETIFDLGLGIQPQRYKKLLGTIKRRGYAYRLELQTSKDGGDGKARDILASWERLELDGGDYLLLMLEDVSEERMLARELRNARVRLLEKREEVNLTLARDIHDTVVQYLIGAGFALEGERKELVELATGEAAERLEKALALAQGRIMGAVADLRRLISELRPPGLLEFGLLPTLQRYIAHLNREAEADGGTHVTLNILRVAPEGASGADNETDGKTDDRAGDEIEDRLSERFRLALFRFTQEALRNVQKHAQAKRAFVTLHLADGEVRLSVHDDGKGFAVPARLGLLAYDDHFGLVGLEEQVSALGGKLAVRSTPGDGSDLVATIPLSPEDKSA